MSQESHFLSLVVINQMRIFGENISLYEFSMGYKSSKLF